MRKTWTDDRLNDFATNVDRRFDEVDRRFDEVDRRFDEVDRRFAEVDRRFDKVDHELGRINDRLDSMGRAMYYGAFTLTGGVLAGFAAITAAILTQT